MSMQSELQPFLDQLRDPKLRQPEMSDATVRTMTEWRNFIELLDGHRQKDPGSAQGRSLQRTMGAAMSIASEVLYGKRSADLTPQRAIDESRAEQGLPIHTPSSRASSSASSSSSVTRYTHADYLRDKRAETAAATGPVTPAASGSIPDRDEARAQAGREYDADPALAEEFAGDRGAYVAHRSMELTGRLPSRR